MRVRALLSRAALGVLFLSALRDSRASAQELAPIGSSIAWRRAERAAIAQPARASTVSENRDSEVARIDSQLAFLETRVRGAPRVTLSVSVDWEGRVLAPENLAAMRAFRDALPEVPLTHFLNAAYFTKAGAEAASVAELMHSVLRPQDELGLHIHSWRSLVEASGVTFRAEPTFWGKPIDVPDSRDVDVGHEVELPAYSRAEIEKIVVESRRRLEAAGFKLGTSFRCGGWLSAPHVLAAIRAQGFRVDTSATDEAWLRPRLEGLPILDRIKELWPDVSQTSEPRWIATPAGSVLEMPDTGALADYVSPEDMLGHLERACERARSSPAREVFAHVGFHQETAARYSGRVREVLAKLARRPDVEIVTLDTAAERARAYLLAP